MLKKDARALNKIQRVEVSGLEETLQMVNVPSLSMVCVDTSDLLSTLLYTALCPWKMTYMDAIPWLSCPPGFCWNQPMGDSGKDLRWGGELGGAFGTLLWVHLSGLYLLTKGHIFLEWADPHQELVESPFPAIITAFPHILCTQGCYQSLLVTHSQIFYIWVCHLFPTHTLPDRITLLHLSFSVCLSHFYLCGSYVSLHTWRRSTISPLYSLSSCAKRTQLYSSSYWILVYSTLFSKILNIFLHVFLTITHTFCYHAIF